MLTRRAFGRLGLGVMVMGGMATCGMGTGGQLTTMAYAQEGNIEERYKNASDLFGRLVFLEQRFDTAMKNLYADDAVIVITELRGSDRRKTTMTGAALKQLIESYLPTAARAGTWYQYSNVTLTPEGDTRMRLLASRTQHGTNKTFPYQLLMGPGPNGSWLIYEEQSIVQP